MVEEYTEESNSKFPSSHLIQEANFDKINSHVGNYKMISIAGQSANT